MTEKRIYFRTSLGTLIVASLLLQIFHEASCSSRRQRMTFTSDNNTLNSTLKKGDDNYYPYEQLFQVVRDTKRILQSQNTTEKLRLNLNSRVYDQYLSGEYNSNLDIGPQVAFSPEDRYPVLGRPGFHPFSGVVHSETTGAMIPAYSNVNTCPVNYQDYEPKRLTGLDDRDYFIINVENELKQTYTSGICKNDKQKCETLSAIQDYSYTCEQTYEKIQNFISIPVDTQISVEQQRLQAFRLPSDCVCRLLRNYS